MRLERRLMAGVGTLALLWLSASQARADVPMYLAKPGEIKIDGVLRDWGGTPFSRLATTIQGNPGGINMRAALAYDRNNIYVAGNVIDPKFVRTSRYGSTEDHAELVLSFPDDNGQYRRVYEVKLFAGKPGETAGQVQAVGLGAVQGAQLVEAPSRDGYTFEAKIPWSLFPPAARNRLKIRGAIRYYDGNGRATSSIIGTAPKGSASRLPLLALAPEQSLARGLLREKSIVAAPSVDVIANVAGDAMKERVLLYDSYVVVYGPNFRKGTEYFWTDLGADPKSGQLPMFEVRDVTGNGKSEIVLRKRITRGGGWREMLQVLSFKGDTPQPIFEHETGISSSVGTIENDVKLVKSGNGYAIQVSLGTDRGYDASNYNEPRETERDSVLLPWGTVQSQTYGWDGSQFVKKSEEKKEAGASAAPRPAGPPPPRPPTSDELLDQVFSLYKKDHKIPKGAPPSFDFVTNVAADGEMERIICHGRDLVVFGKGFREGRGYVSMSMPQFTSNEDIRHVSAHDLTGEGHADIIVRGLQRTEAPENIGDGEMVREVLYVYKVDETTITRVFAAETAVVFGDQRIQSLLAFLPGTSGLDIELRPGRAMGWDRATWPYKQDTEAVSGVEPIVLPWTDQPVRFHYNDGKYGR
jgi:hypothetical protein